MNATTKTAHQYLDRNAGGLATLNDSIFYFGELGMQEHETCRLMTGLLEEAGFHIERSIAGFPTGFCATWGGQGPVIALHTEYDANPDNSQKPGIARPEQIVPGAPGHCEGHNVNAAVLVASALAAQHTMRTHNLSGRLKIFGAPAEEQVISRPYFVRDGWFDDVDLAVTPHIATEFRVGYGLIQSALVSVVFSFVGESSHAGVAPWQGRDALDAVVLMDMGMAQYREHMTTTMRCQRVITNGGSQPNIVPGAASIWWYLRDSTTAGVQRLLAQARRIAEGAALMTNTSVEVEILSAAWPVRGNRVLAELLQEHYLELGEPAWTSDDQQLARAVQQAAGVAADGLSKAPVRIVGPARQRPSANDAGDISWKVPHAKLFFPGNIPNISNHHWGAGVALATPIAHKGAAAASKVMAGAVLDCFANPDLIAEAKRTFAEEVTGTEFKTMLPAGQRPPMSLNAETMEKFRPAMRAHYIADRPRFV